MNKSTASASMLETMEGTEDIPLADQITMGPIQKYKKYNVFPWDFAVHICIVIFTTL